MNAKNKIKRISLLLTAVLLLSACSLFFSSCGMRTSTHDEESGLSFYLNADKDGYYVQADGSKTDYVIPEEFKDKPVIGIVENGFSGVTYTSVTVPSSLVYVGPDAFVYDKSCKYNRYDGGYYLGNDENPYVILVYTDEEYVDVADGCKSICDGAISKYVHSLSIPSTVEYISHKAFINASVTVTVDETTKAKDLVGLLNVSVSSENKNYKSINNMVLNKDGTRLLYLAPSPAMVIPSTVEFIELGAIVGGYTFYIEPSEDGGIYIPSENNPYFLLYGYHFEIEDYDAKINVNIKDGVKVIATHAFSPSYIDTVTVPDSVVQIFPNAFYNFNGNANVVLTSSGWFDSCKYLDGMAYDFGVSSNTNPAEGKSKFVYIKEGQYTKIVYEDTNAAAWHVGSNNGHTDIRRYED